MAELKCNDGTVIQISVETEAELRKAFESKHVWDHGDVFKNVAGVQIYLEPHKGPIVVNLEHTDSGGTPEVQLPGPDTVFLFNIREKL